MLKRTVSTILILFTGFHSFSQDSTNNGFPQRNPVTNENTNKQETKKDTPIVVAKRKIIRGFAFQAENDVFAALLKLKNEDKDYSGGFKFEFYTDYLAKGIIPFFMNRKDPFDLGKNVNSIYIQGMGYTPNRDAFDKTDPVKDQRPYSSLIGIGRKRIAIFDHAFGRKKGGALILITDLFLGKIGTKGPGRVQNYLHEYLTSSDEVMGWDNQIANGGKFAYNYNIIASYELANFAKNKAYIIATPHFSWGNIFRNQGFKLGITNLSVKKQPFFQSMNSNQKNDIDNSEIKEKSYADAVKEEKEQHAQEKWFRRFKFEAYGKAYHVNHNSLLMGMPFKDNSVYTIPFDKINRWVYDAGVKLFFPYYPDKTKGNTMKRKNVFYIEFMYRSKEFSYGPEHVYGGIGVQFLKID